MKTTLQRIPTTLALVAGMACATTLVASPVRAGTTFYGIDNDNNIWEVDPIRKFNKLINEVGRTITDCATTNGCLNTSQGSNGIAYDTDRDHLFFFYNPVSTGPTRIWDLRFWNRKNFGINSLKVVKDADGVDISGTNIPANAAYFDNALWYFDGSATSSNLNKLLFTYNEQQDDIISATLKTYDLSGFGGEDDDKYTPGQYGDIAINNQTGFLYGSQTNANFFKIDLNKLDDDPKPSLFTSLGKTQTLNSSGVFVDSGFQLSFNADNSKLFGTRFCNNPGNCSGYDNSSFTAQAGDGIYFEIVDFDTPMTRQFGTADLLYASSPGFRDLGGATANALVPGPLPILGVGGAFGWSRRLRRKLNKGAAKSGARKSH